MKINSSKDIGPRLCITIKPDGVTVYGNKQSLKLLAQHIENIAAADESQHYECHTLMALEDDDSKFGGKEPRNVWLLADKECASVFHARSENNPGFELTFMAVENGDLDHMAQFQKGGVLPENWGAE